MSYINRGMEAKVLGEMDRYGAILVTGPRQAGKSTMLRQICKEKWGEGWLEFSFDTPKDIASFRQDPELFFLNHPGPLLLDEVQNVPDIFPWLKKEADKSQGRTRFIMTGSQHFPLMRGVAESMAGRVLILDLLPFSRLELRGASPLDLVNGLLDPQSLVPLLGKSFPCSDTEAVHPAMLVGGYPAQAVQGLGDLWFSSYRSTYVQRDIRMAGLVQDISTFDRFLMLCAGASGSIVNKANFADTLGVDAKTVDKWLSLLESGYQAVQIPAWSQNTAKRVVKRPKLVFCDSGLGLHLQAIRSADTLAALPHFGNLFEGWVVSEAMRNFACTGMDFNAYHWRTSNGVECDLVLQHAGKLVPIEVKHTAKPSTNDVKGIVAFRREHREASTGILVSMKPTVEWICPGVLNLPVGLFC